MLHTSARLLRLLSLLQTRRDWSSADLAERLGVAPRTVRRDVERLRALGYPVHSAPGVAGGYRLAAGADLPPLLLDDEEAVAVAVGLRTAANGTVTGIEETSLRALAKLEQVLPARLRHRVNTLQTHTVRINREGPTVDAEVLTRVAAACRDREQLRFDYTGHDGVAACRSAEPYGLVSKGNRWYLVAWDTDRRDWRTFRADRMRLRTPNGPRFAPREPPEPDVAAWVQRRLAHEMWPVEARFLLHAPAERVAGRVSGTVEPLDGERCLLTLRGDDPHTMAVVVAFLDVDFEVLEPVELKERLRALGSRLSAV
ncbi:Transcriptional regulator, DeoR family [[Actinomadura] parvosata subsp. kistnae]|uniref:DNA-binding transcriptional regulator n=1 Tax=[Actinomadura] parvosata subsp. kistnae TaxID=1909395 RepID=A0A1V0A1V5_9ACTN|nr:YafY family protein [Nonomuraea sp. ATCC 55076]AQZ64190.1 DNA-binding transcriptional regulator [Nonomuraea sp. ATCC 55076]SPM00007.1 Transcriptional regulator, DeoR family [Actinomadura parvosata subsp. kistnae]